MCPFLANVITLSDKRKPPATTIGWSLRGIAACAPFLTYIIGRRPRQIAVGVFFFQSRLHFVYFVIARLVVSRQLPAHRQCGPSRTVRLYSIPIVGVMRKMFKRETTAVAAADHVIYYATLRWNHLNARAATIYHIIFEPTSTPCLCVCVRALETCRLYVYR